MKNKPTKPISTFPKSQWKIWLWGVILFLVIFMVIKEVSKPAESLPAEINKKHKLKVPIGISDIKIDESVSNNIAFPDDEPITLPSFPKGEKAFASYIQRNIHVDARTKGKAIVLFVVSKTGKLTDIKILRSVNEKVDREVVKALQKSPKWNPGKKKISGKAVDVAFSFPVNFDK